jgi:hypothetical protein
MPLSRVIGYLAACAAAGAVVGRAFGAFARAPFHYPFALQDVSPARRALLEALDAFEWPALFGLTLACSLALWAWLRPRTQESVPRPSGRAITGLLAVFAAGGALAGVLAVDGAGGLLAALPGGALGSIVAALLGSSWREAASARTVGARWLRQMPLAAGHLVTTSVAALSLGYHGESALIHAVALAAGFGLFASELLLALAIAVLVAHTGRAAAARSDPQG